MEAVIQKWGNSKAVRIPKAALSTAGFKEKDKVEIVVKEGAIVLKKSGFVHRTLKERLSGYERTIVAPEYDTASLGEERFWEHE